MKSGNKINPLNNPDAITASFFAIHSWQKTFLARSKKTVAKPSAKAPQRFCRLGYLKNSNSTLFGRILAAYTLIFDFLQNVECFRERINQNIAIFFCDSNQFACIIRYQIIY